MLEKGTKVTPEGLKKLEDELELYRSVKRPEVAERIKQAISFGDISENSEYEDAKNEQAMVEGRIIELEKKIASAIIIDTKDLDDNTVNVGHTVELKDMEFKERLIYTIVGSTEADPEENKISDESPVGKAIIGHQVGDRVNVHVPGGMVLQFKILNIKK
mgnify:CR=1 FL=1